jgi:hypothetical protein
MQTEKHHEHDKFDCSSSKKIGTVQFEKYFKVASNLAVLGVTASLKHKQ